MFCGGGGGAGRIDGESRPTAGQRGADQEGVAWQGADAPLLSLL